MPSPMQQRVRAVLWEAGPLTLGEIVAGVAAREPLPGKNPTTSVRNALRNDALCQSTGHGRYVYLPAFIRGASVRVPMDAAPTRGELSIGAEVVALLWPQDEHAVQAGAATLQLVDGPTVVVERARRLGSILLGTPETELAVELPAPFWDWWTVQRGAGADTLVLRCDDGEAVQFAVQAVGSAALDPATVAARNAQLRETAAEVLQPTQGLATLELARRLLAHGVYHGEPPPDPLTTVLFEPPGSFTVENGYKIAYRAELTPALRRLLADRLEANRRGDLLIRRIFRLPLAAEGEPPLAAPIPRPRRRRQPQCSYRIKVALQWDRRVWRLVEILDTQTLEDLHYAIQDAFGWDDDHLYAFFLSGRPWDSLTEIGRPGNDAAEPPTADEVQLADLELEPGRRLLYIFDFGDELRHELEVQAVVPKPASGDFPRIVESHGEAPAQYASWEDEEDDE